MKDPPVVLVAWVDSTGLESGGWVDVEEIDAHLSVDAMRYESVGYLVGDGPDAIALAGDRNASLEDNDERNTRFGAVRTIPRRSLLGRPIRLTSRGKMTSARKGER